MQMDVLVEVRVAMLHRDVDICQLDLIVVIEVVVVLFCQDDVANLCIVVMCPEVPEDDVLEVPIWLKYWLLKLVVDVLDVH